MDDSIKETVKSTWMAKHALTLGTGLLALILAIVSLFMMKQLMQHTSKDIAALKTQVSQPLQSQSMEMETLKQDIAELQTTQARILAEVAALKTAPAAPVMAKQDPAPYLELSNIDTNIQRLPIITPPQTITPQYPKKSASTQSWRERLLNSWEALKSLVVIRHNEQSTPALISPNQTANLLQNMHLLIVQTQLAYVQQDDSIYHHNIRQAINWIHQYFDGSNEKTKAVLASLQDLDTLHIDPRPSSSNP